MAVQKGCGDDVPSGPNIESLVHANTSDSIQVLLSNSTSNKGSSSSYWSLYQFAAPKDFVLMAIGIVCAMISGSAQPLSTLVFGELTNVFVDWQRQPSVGALVSQADLLASVSKGASYFLILAAVAFVTSYLHTAIFLYTSERQIHSYRKEYLAAVLRQDAQWFDTQGAGTVSYQLVADIDQIREGLGEKVPGTVQALSTFVAAIVIAFTQSWKLTLALFSIMPVIVATMGVVNVFGARFQTKILQLYSTASAHAEESLTAIRTVVAFGAQQRMAKRYNAGLTAAREEGIKKSFSLATGLGIVFFLLFSGYSLTFYYGAILLELGEITAGQIINVFFAVLIGSFALGHAVPDFQTYSIATVSCHKLKQTLDRVPPIDSVAEGDTIPTSELKGHIHVQDVDFTYPSRPDNQVLHRMTLDIQPGTTVALVGESGSGKSTIIQILERFYNPSHGSITLDGRPIQSLQVKWLRRQIGLVGQEPVLFDGTVAENVAHGLLGSDLESLSPEVKREMIVQACQQANAHDFIVKMPYGYDSQVGERGMLLSGGQKQRLCIARAIIKNPKILLLDEATSALDTTSERIVQAAIEKASKGRTTIVIAHRLSTIRDANQIVVMVRGRITEQGTHNELLDHPDGLYKRLVEAQSVQKEEAVEVTETEETDQNSASTVAFESIKPKEEKSPIVSRESTKRSIRSTNTVLSLLGDVEAAERVRYSASKVLLEMLKFSQGQYVYLAIALFAAILNGMVYPCYAIVFGGILNVFAQSGPAMREAANVYALAFFIIAIANFFINFFQTGFFGFAAEHLTEKIRIKMFWALLHQDIDFYDKDENSVGILTSRLASEAQDIQGASGLTLGSIIQVLITLIGGFVIGLAYGWKLTLVAMISIPVLIIAGYCRMRLLASFAEKSRAAYAKSSRIATEAVAAIKTVQYLTRENDVHQKYIHLLEEPLRDGLRSAWTTTPIFAFSQSANFIVNSLVFYYGGRLIAYEGYTVQQFFTVFVAIVFGAMGIGRIFAFAPDISKAFVSGDSVLQLLETKPHIDPRSEDGKKVKETKGEFSFKGIHFNYPTRPHFKVLQGLDLEIKQGQFIAFVGPSGCGKSTTIGLIERFYNQSKGRVYLDSIPIDELNLSSYRSQIGLVSQEPNLFDMTVKENVTLGCPNLPSPEAIESACKDANIHSFIKSLPQGYDTKLGGKGGQLSGGQKQRIAIARALVRNPRILLLDEATSALDAESEKVVQEALDQAAKGRTTIAIAHRLSSIQNADVIYVLKNGRVTEKGSHQELVELKGVYYELVQQQNLERT